MKYHHDCLHIREGISVQHNISDYWPLTREEVLELLQQATFLRHERKASYSLSSIQLRLRQGIPGIQCPYNGEAIEQKILQLAQFYRHFRESTTEVTEMTVDIVWTLLQYERKKEHVILPRK